MIKKMEINNDLWTRILDCLENIDENFEDSIVVKANVNIIHKKLVENGFKGIR